MGVQPEADSERAEFERLGADSQPSLLVELFDFLRYNKKWWLIPILLVIGLFGLLVALAVSPAAPFIYTLF
jgi:hypothetical protein